MPCERSRTFFSLSSEVPDCFIAAYRVAGMIKEADDTAIREDMVDATLSDLRVSTALLE